MKLTMSTELGQFVFHLSQSSVVHLLNEAQSLDDRGGLPEITSISKRSATENHFESAPFTIRHEEDDPILKMVEKAGEKVLQKAAEKQERTDSPENLDGNTGFFTMKEVKNFPKIKKKSAKIQGPKDGKYKGFLYIRCDHCGEEIGYYAKERTNEFSCRECGKKTDLSELRWANVDCKCGKHFTYRTNAKSEILTINCINCGFPVDMMINTGRNAYVSIGTY